jgi:uncharacterized membrane-anchored protein YitT (DUF2179 family)
LVLRIITQSKAVELAHSMRAAGYGVTQVDAKGGHGRVDLLFTVIERKDLPEVVRLVESSQPMAFYSIEDTRMVKAGIFPQDARDAPVIAASPKTIRRVRTFWRSLFHRLLR